MFLEDMEGRLLYEGRVYIIGGHAEFLIKFIYFKFILAC